MNVTLDYYRIFYEIVKAGSFSKAAKVLFVSQSSVSQSLAKLEEALGLTLIERTTKSMKLTSAGELLYADVTEVIERISHSEKRMAKLVRMDEGSISIGVSDTICRYFLMPYLSRYKKAYPNIHITLSNRPSAVSVQALRGGEIDLAVVNVLPNMKGPDTDIIELKSFDEVLITRVDSAIDELTTLEELIDYPFISLEKGATTRDYTEMIFAAHGLEFKPEIELSSLDLIFDFVKAGFGIGVVPEYALEAHQDIKVVKLPLDGTLSSKAPSEAEAKKRQIGVVTSSKLPQNIATKQFIKDLLGKD